MADIETGLVDTAMETESDAPVVTGAMESTVSEVTVATSDAAQPKQKQLGFMCRTCGEKFSRRSLLDTHKCSHRVKQPIGCQRCRVSKTIDPKTGAEKLVLKLCDVCKRTLKAKVSSSKSVSGTIPELVKEKGRLPCSSAKPSPVMATGTPVMAIGTPVMAIGTPVMATGTPVMAAGTPIMATRTPVMAAPMMVLQSGTPIVAARAGTPVMAAGTPVMATGTPVMTTGNPVMAAPMMVLQSGTPIMATRTPVMATGTQFMATGTQVMATGTQVMATAGTGTLSGIISAIRGSGPEAAVVKTTPSEKFGALKAGAIEIAVVRASDGDTSIGVNVPMATKTGAASMVTETSAIKVPMATKSCAATIGMVTETTGAVKVPMSTETGAANSGRASTKTGAGKATSATDTGAGKATSATDTGAGKALDKTTEAAVFQCNECDKNYQTKVGLKQHIKNSHQAGHLCQYCGKGFNSKGKQLEHERIHTGEKPFKCNLCMKEFRIRALWRRHIKSEHTFTTGGEKQSFSCDVCHKSYARKSVLTEHMRNVHSPYSNQSHKCEHCAKAFWTVTKLKNHMRVHTGEREYACPRCEHCYATPHSLRAHLQSFHGEKVEAPALLFKCSQCDKRYQEKKNLLEHMNVHTGATPYKCRECGEAFASANGRRFHEDKHRFVAPKTPRKPRAPGSRQTECICVHCDKVLPSSEALRKHKLEHNIGNGYKCTQCQEVFYRRQLLMKHMNLVHIKIFKCRHCSLTFTSLSMRRTHEQRHRPERSKAKVSYKCSVCSKVFHCRQVGIDHMNLHMGVKPYKCSDEDCEATFMTMSGRRNHQRQHNTGLLKCLICDKQFRDQRSFKDHINVHTGATPYKCRQCELTFSTRSGRYLHEQKHTDNFEYQCHYTNCKKSFAQKRGLTEHLNLHTGATPYECQYCQQAFNTKYKLRHHWLSCKLNMEKVQFKCDVCQKCFYSQKVCEDHMNIHTGAKPYKCRAGHCEQTFHTLSTRRSHESLKHKK